MKFWKLVSASTALVLSTSVNAALVGRLAATEGGTDYQAYYDDVADLTWLADANYSQTSGYDADGRMFWADANSWAAGLTVDGVDGWRLADTLQPDLSCDAQTSSASYNLDCTGSEMGNMFHNVLGGGALQDISTTHNANYDLFSNIQSNYYWSATEYAPNTDNAWAFNFGNGHQGNADKSFVIFNHYAWAVHSGDVSAVPVPAAIWLFGSGLIGLVGFSKRKKS